MDEDYWTAVRTMRLDIADLLESLAPGEWDEPSLCRGWRVRDVAGHLAVVPVITTWQMMAVAPRARFDPNRINTLIATREGSRRPNEILALLRERAGERGTARLLDTRNALFDVIVHSQDIALPLGRDFPVPVTLAHQGVAAGLGDGVALPGPQEAGPVDPARHRHRLARGGRPRGERTSPGTAASPHRSQGSRSRQPSRPRTHLTRGDSVVRSAASPKPIPTSKSREPTRAAPSRNGTAPTSARRLPLRVLAASFPTGRSRELRLIQA